MYRGEGNQESQFSKDSILSKLEIKRNRIPYDIESNKTLPNSELLKRTGLSKELFKKYNEGLLSDEEQATIEDKFKKAEGIYFQSNSGLNLTNPSKLWSGYSFRSKDGAIGLKLSDIILGFKLNTRNVVLHDYCAKVDKLMKEQDIAEADSFVEFNKRNRYENSEFQTLAEKTIKALLEPIKRFKDKKRGIPDKRIGRSQDQGSHPCLPIILNHPDIPELRWCHADYAAIPTKKGYNILEMIT